MLMIIDLGLLHIHRDRELRSLAIQIELANSIVRRSEIHRLVAVAPMKVKGLEYLELSARRSGYDIHISPLERVVDIYSIRRAIVLDPYGDQDLRPKDLAWAEAIIIGGIVDRTPIKRATRMLRDMNIPWAPTMRISLRGSIVGVPGEINSIVAIVSRAIETGDLEGAIGEAQPARDAVLRASIEIQRILRKTNKDLGFYDLMEIYRSLKTWLNLDELGMLRALIRCGRRDLADLWRRSYMTEKPPQGLESKLYV